MGAAKILIAALCFLLIGCSSSCRQWILWGTITHDASFNSGRMFLEPEKLGSQIEIEISRGASGTRMYINLLILPSAPLPNDPSRTAVELIVGDQEPRVFYPYRLLGGQRLLVPDEITEEIIQYLLDGESVVIKMGRNKVQVVPDNFEKSYDGLMAIPVAE